MSDGQKLKFNKSVSNDEIKNPQHNNIKKQKMKEILIKKYNLSENEAEEKIIQIEKRTLNKKSNDINNHEKSQKQNNTKQIHKKENTKNNIKNTNNIKQIHKKENTKNNIKNTNNIKQNNDIKIDPQKNKNNSSSIFQKETKIPMKDKKIEKKTIDVDELLGEIVLDYNQDISIELEHVSLTFDVQEDRIDNLKEQIIRTLKRNKSETSKFHVLTDVSFKIYQGEKVGIIGYNGAGKSTLLKLITGIYKPDEGNVKTNGTVSPLLSLGAGFDYNFSGAKNIYLNAAVLGYEKEFIDTKFDEIIEFADLGKFINIPIRNYSSGMLAKLGFAIATVVNPDILIIDEILGVGDVNFQRKSHDKMKSLMGGKTTVLFVSHSINQIRELCDKAIWIDKGKVREIGEVNEVCDHYLKDSEKATKEQLKDIQFK